MWNAVDFIFEGQRPEKREIRSVANGKGIWKRNLSCILEALWISMFLFVHEKKMFGGGKDLVRGGECVSLFVRKACLEGLLMQRGYKMVAQVCLT